MYHIILLSEVALIVVKTFPDMEDMEKIATNSRKKAQNRTITRLLLKIARLMLKSTIFALWKQIDRKIGGVIQKIWLISYKVK
jgi:hypothetical protein